MPAKIGNDTILGIRFGNIHITKAYYGDNLIYDKPYVRLKFYFDNSNVNPRSKISPIAKANGAEWLSTSDPHVWHLLTPLYTKGISTTDNSLGLARLFVDKNDKPMLIQSQVGTCQVTDIVGDIDKIQIIDRIFYKCDAINSISGPGFYDKFKNSTELANVGGLCNGCTNITDGSSLYGYQVLSTYCPNISVHSGSFTNADSQSNLDQIPTSWGGNMAPPANQIELDRVSSCGWSLDSSDPNYPDFSTITQLEVFTIESLSQFDQINMKKQSITNRTNGFSAATNSATYYYPAFFQGTGTWPSAAGTSNTFTPTWVFAPDIYNGMVESGISPSTSKDMPGTLDHELYGPLSNKFGSYDSNKITYFGFLVLNDPSDISNFNTSSTKYGIHYNQYLLPTSANPRIPVLSWFLPT